jgi:hypothetical protein
LVSAQRKKSTPPCCLAALYINTKEVTATGYA